MATAIQGNPMLFTNRWRHIVRVLHHQQRKCSITTFPHCPAVSTSGPSTWNDNNMTTRNSKHYYKKTSKQQRYFLSSLSSSSPSSSLMSFNPINTINLLPYISELSLLTIQTLPEVEEVLSLIKDNKPISKRSMEGLERAKQIFQHVGTSEYESILFLQATCLSQLNQYNEVIQILSSLGQHHEGEHSNDIFQFNNRALLCKLKWYSGKFEEGLEDAYILNEKAPAIITGNEYMTSLRQGCAMNASALHQLALINMEDGDIRILRKQNKRNIFNSEQEEPQKQLQDVMDIQEIQKMSSNILHNTYQRCKSMTSNNDDIMDYEISQCALACAASYSNQGIANLMGIMIQNKIAEFNHSSSSIGYKTPLDSAMNLWKKSLMILDDLDLELYSRRKTKHLNKRHNYVSNALKATVYCNMSWAILFSSSYTSDYNHTSSPSLKEDQLKKASEYSSLALKLCDGSIIEMGNEKKMDVSEADENIVLKPLMGRALGLVASCYSRAGSAVTSEGLLQSAMDVYKSDKDGNIPTQPCPLSTLDFRSSYFYYSSLCSQWDKREIDAKQNLERACNIDDSLSKNWRGKNAVYSGLWFFSTFDF